MSGHLRRQGLRRVRFDYIGKSCVSTMLDIGGAQGQQRTYPPAVSAAGSPASVIR